MSFDLRQRRHASATSLTPGASNGPTITTALDQLLAGRSRSAPIASPAPTPAPRERQVSIAPTSRALSLQPSSWNPEARTVDVVWTTGARGIRVDFDTLSLVDEELATGTANVRLDRLNRGAPVLNWHQQGDVRAQIGTVVPGTARMVAGQGVATLKLSDREDVAPIVTDIAAGILRNLSVGYTVHVFQVDPTASPRPLYLAVDWEPTEISFCSLPFDAGAQVRSAPSGTAQPCIIRTANPKEPPKMSTSWMSRFTRALSGSAAPAVIASTPSEEGEIAAPSYQRQASIAWLRSYTAMARDTMELPSELCGDLALEMAERQLSEGDARDAVMHILAQRQQHASRGMGAGGSPVTSPAGNALIFGERSMDNPTFQASAVQDAIYARLSGTKPTDAARQFMGMTMIQMAGDMLERQGVRTRTMAPGEIIEAASWNRVGARAGYMHQTRAIGPGATTSDFPDLLRGAGQRFLLDVFGAAASPLKQVARQRTAMDFRAISSLQLSGFGTLPKVLESGEVKHGGFVEAGESYKLESFAKIFGLSREAIINDDLGAFSQSTRIMGRAAAETEAQLLANIILSNPKMRDGKPLFDAAHGNYAADGGAPSFATLDAARLMMREQKDLDGVTPLATAPKFILSGPQREIAIEQLVKGVLNPTDVASVNPFAGALTPLVDPRLPGLGWFLFADPNLSPVIEYAYLSGREGPQMDTREGWNTLGTEYRVYMDFGAGVVDARGAYKNSGAPAA